MNNENIIVQTNEVFHCGPNTMLYPFYIKGGKIKNIDISITTINNFEGLETRKVDVQNKDEGYEEEYIAGIAIDDIVYWADINDPKVDDYLVNVSEESSVGNIISGKFVDVKVANFWEMIKNDTRKENFCNKYLYKKTDLYGKDKYYDPYSTLSMVDSTFKYGMTEMNSGCYTIDSFEDWLDNIRSKIRENQLSNSSDEIISEDDILMGVVGIYESLKVSDNG